MEAQEIFDTVAKHLAAQGRKAVAGATGFCSYRTDGGLKCAAGALLTDDEYSPDLDGIGGVKRLYEAGRWPRRIGHVGLVHALQGAHDTASSGDDLAYRLRETARTHNLSTAILDTLSFPAVWEW